ncbi:MAG: hypothetical protein OJF49_003391 [Ktedonobacterales bacterium]|jgi:hypothetical protein|nr:MAG: hypothetical protein OJF49_003391 [Ktedonobacterales bacterium]
MKPPHSATSKKQNKPRVTRTAAEQLLRTRERIMRGRTFADDSTDLLRAARDERMEHL